MLVDKIVQAANLIQQAHYVVVLSGAGISTPSGIPDFRSADSSLWHQHNPMEVASIMAFRQNPQLFYEWVRPLAEQISVAQPNPAHFALAQLEAVGELQAIITQNVDGLHQAATSKNVLEVHGHTRQMTCMRCYTIQDSATVFETFLAQGNLPQCQQCGGILKPNVILFGEQLPVQTLYEARSTVAKADLLLVVGSSLEVAPVSELPQQAQAQQTKIIVINTQDTYIDNQADLVIQHDLTEVLPELTRHVVDSIGV